MKVEFKQQFLNFVSYGSKQKLVTTLTQTLVTITSIIKSPNNSPIFTICNDLINTQHGILQRMPSHVDSPATQDFFLIAFSASSLKVNRCTLLFLYHPADPDYSFINFYKNGSIPC